MTTINNTPPAPRKALEFGNQIELTAPVTSLEGGQEIPAGTQLIIVDDFADGKPVYEAVAAEPTAPFQYDTTRFVLGQADAESAKVVSRSIGLPPVLRDQLAEEYFAEQPGGKAGVLERAEARRNEWLKDSQSDNDLADQAAAARDDRFWASFDERHANAGGTPSVASPSVAPEPAPGEPAPHPHHH
jgi:hypothetical protein